MKHVDLELNDEEEAVVAELLQRGGFSSEQHIAKLGIYKVAEYFDIVMSAEAFTVPYSPRMRAILDAERPRERRVPVSPLFDPPADEVKP